MARWRACRRGWAASACGCGCWPLARLPDDLIHDPSAAGGDALRAANVRLGQNYPRPIVDHAAARVRALEAYQGLKG